MFTNHENDVLVRELREEFLQMAEFQQNLLFEGPPPRLTNDEVESACFQRVVDHLLANPAPIDLNSIIPKPDFEAKLVFNRLGDPAATQLRAASYAGTAQLETFFRYNRAVVEKLAQRFRRLYREACMRVPNSKDQQPAVFLEILGQSTPMPDSRLQNAALMLMSYFFEVCDIFEPPPNPPR